jgi:hypothetical protein
MNSDFDALLCQLARHRVDLRDPQRVIMIRARTRGGPSPASGDGGE